MPEQWASVDMKVFMQEIENKGHLTVLIGAGQKIVD